MGDFHSTTSEKEMKEFCDMYGFGNLIEGPTCYKNASSPSSIDIMLTNKKSDFHKMTITVLKKY